MITSILIKIIYQYLSLAKILSYHGKSELKVRAFERRGKDRSLINKARPVILASCPVSSCGFPEICILGFCTSTRQLLLPCGDTSLYSRAQSNGGRFSVCIGP